MSRGYKVLINKNCKFFKINIQDKKKIRNILIKHKIDTVVHLAAYIKVDESVKKPNLYFNNNNINTVKLIESIKNTSVERFIFSSSSSVYGKINKKIREKDTKHPISPYGRSKLLAEKNIRKLCEKYKIKNVILRYFNVVGAQVKEKPYLGQINLTGQLFQNLCLYLKGKKKNFQFLDII